MADSQLIPQELSALRSALAQQAERVARRNQLAAMLQNLHQEAVQLQDKVQRLKKALEKEEADVERLQKMSATAILFTVLGKKEAKMDKEAREAAAARVHYTDAVAQLEDCQARIAETESALDALTGCDEAYATLFGQLRTLLRQYPETAKALEAREAQRLEAYSQLREREEAIGAGKAALAQAEQVLDSLSGAAGWGTFDLIGGGLLADIAKYSHLDTAQEHMRQLDALLRRFRTELADVHMAPALGNVISSGFLQAIDIFFDNIFADWMVLSQIHDAQNQVAQVQYKISDALDKLSKLHAYRLEEASKLDQEINRLIAGT